MVYAPGQGTGFTSVGDYLDANQGTIARETSDVGSQMGGQIDAAKGAADQLIASDKSNYAQDYTTIPGYRDALDKAIAAKDQTAPLSTSGGVSDYFQKHFGDTRSQGDFDASLLGGQFAPLQARAGGLIDYLNQGLAAVRPPEPKPPGEAEGEHPYRPANAPPDMPDRAYPTSTPSSPGRNQAPRYGPRGPY